jgi:hypothetical protein
MRVLLVEPKAGGHRGPYAASIAESLVSVGLNVSLVTLPEATQHPSFRRLSSMPAARAGASLEVCPTNGSIGRRWAHGNLIGLLEREAVFWRLYRRWYDHHSARRKIDAVFVPYLDNCIHACSLFGSPFRSSPWAGITMRTSFHHRDIGISPKPGRFDAVEKMLFLRLLRNRYLRRLLALDESILEHPLIKSSAVASKVAAIPEPIEAMNLLDRRTAKACLSFNEERKVLLVYGGITVRKGVSELLRAARHPDFPSGVTIVLAGQFSSEVRDLLAPIGVDELQCDGRLLMIDRFIELGEEELLFSAADIIWLGYKGHYTPSGVLAKAAQAQRPVIACDEGLIGWQTEKRALGQIVQITDVGAVCRAVERLLEQSGAGHSFHTSNDTTNVASLVEAAGVIKTALSESLPRRCY